MKTEVGAPRGAHQTPTKKSTEIISGHGPGRCLPIRVAMRMVAVDRAVRAEQLRDDEADAGNTALPVAREVWRHPTFNEISARRVHTDAPCSSKCGRCSRCFRAAQVLFNMNAFSAPDYPGGPA